MTGYRTCVNCESRISRVRRADAEYCSDTCRRDYERKTRELGREELGKRRRMRENLAALKQAVEGAVVRIKILAIENQTNTEYWVSGYYMAHSDGLMSVKQKDGELRVYDLRLVEISLPLESRADALPFGG